MRKRIAIALLAAAATLPPLPGQVRISARSPGAPGFATPQPLVASPRGITITFGQPQPLPRVFPPRFFPTEFFLGEPLFADYPTAVTQQTPPVIVVETAPGTAEAKDEKRPAAAPLLIEWRGDRYVRFNGAQQNASLVEEQRGQPDYVEEFGAGEAQVARAHKSLWNKEARGLPPAVLVFRDGRREEVSSYTIIGGVMYVNSEFWTSGSWTERIQLADLDVPTTVKLNQERGVKFVLPAAPNEVVTRP